MHSEIHSFPLIPQQPCAGLHFFPFQDDCNVFQPLTLLLFPFTQMRRNRSPLDLCNCSQTIHISPSSGNRDGNLHSHEEVIQRQSFTELPAARGAEPRL